MNPELSRRADRVRGTDVYANLSASDRLKFAEAIHQVLDFDQLPKKCKDIIISGERELQGY